MISWTFTIELKELTAFLPIIELVIGGTLWVGNKTLAKSVNVTKNTKCDQIQEWTQIFFEDNILLHPIVGDSIPIFGEKSFAFLLLLKRTSQRAFVFRKILEMQIFFSSMTRVGKVMTNTNSNVKSSGGNDWLDCKEIHLFAIDKSF